jgi:hypothetical protein
MTADPLGLCAASIGVIVGRSTSKMCSSPLPEPAVCFSGPKGARSPGTLPFCQSAVAVPLISRAGAPTLEAHNSVAAIIPNTDRSARSLVCR